MELNPEGDIFSWNLKCLYATTLIDVTLAGIQIFMWIYMLTRFKTTPKESKPARFFYLIVSFVLLWLTTAAAVINGLAIYRILFFVIPGEMKNGWTIFENTFKELLVESEVIWSTSVFITDGVMVYRCYSVWFDRKWAAGLPFFLFLVNIGISIKSVSTLFGPGERDMNLDMANIFISTFLHIIITILICGKLSHAHRRVEKALSSRARNPFAGSISILIESAAPLAVFGLGTAITVALPPSVLATKAGMVLQIPYKFFMTLSLQLIIFRVAMGWSWADKDESRALISQDIQFTNVEV
ncbi:hypothetical protein BKA70DRAFT_1568074 [Coprinopsis sp. MPI-PUGE-AT-0042]|nr:hypothetical protein BKA70DRAFT_1568074 [Coprinopsis sp. MPI-PUGE-AT-0042]